MFPGNLGNSLTLLACSYICRKCDADKLLPFLVVNSSSRFIGTVVARLDESAICMCLVQKILQNFSDFPSHQILRHMHGALNIDKNNN